MNIAKAQQMSKDKAARRSEARNEALSNTSKKRIASMDEPRGCEETRQQRGIYLAEKCRLEEELRRIEAELSALDKNDGLSIASVDDKS